MENERDIRKVERTYVYRRYTDADIIREVKTTYCYRRRALRFMATERFTRAVLRTSSRRRDRYCFRRKTCRRRD